MPWPATGDDAFRMTVSLVELVATQPAASTGVAAWAAAAAVSGALPSARSVRALRRRAALLTWLIVGGLTSLVLALVVPAAGSVTPEQAALLAAPAAGAALAALPLLGGLRATARAFAPAPGTPTPPALRASAAHPMLALPVQVAALAAAAGAVFAAGIVEAASLAVLLTLLAAASGTTALYAGIRYGRLRELTTRPARTVHTSAVNASALVASALGASALAAPAVAARPAGHPTRPAVHLRVRRAAVRPAAVRPVGAVRALAGSAPARGSLPNAFRQTPAVFH
jgi:hypothetical protein